MTDPVAMPAEDRGLCRHEWVDLYEGGGVSRRDPYTALATFYCKFCLVIQVISYSRRRFSLSQEYLDQYEEDNNGPGGVTV